MDAVYPASASALARGRRLRRAAAAGADTRARTRTVPVTFAEIKEVDEDTEERAAGVRSERRRHDVLGDRLGLRRRREPGAALRELSPPVPAPAPPALAAARAGSEPALALAAPAADDTDT